MPTNRSLLIYHFEVPGRRIQYLGFAVRHVRYSIIDSDGGPDIPCRAATET